jgi:hypothetical protein
MDFPAEMALLVAVPDAASPSTGSVDLNDLQMKCARWTMHARCMRLPLWEAIN